jgi:hypothetical protein
MESRNNIMTALSRPLFKYFGSKWNTSRYYPPPTHQRINDCCCGSATYPSQYPEHEIYLYDIDLEVVSLLNWLITVDSEVIMSLPCEELKIGQDLRELELPGYGADLIRRWQRVGTNTCWTVSKWGHLPGQWQPSTRKAVAENIKRIRHWKVELLSYEYIPDLPATYFIDPPYQYVKGYPHESINYKHLAQWARSRQGQVIVCEQDGAHWLPFREFKTIPSRCAASRKPGSKSREVIWTNNC